MAEGSCLCGEVAFAVHEAPTQIELCHCSKCRRAYGAAFAATLYCRRSAFVWIRGERRVKVYDHALEQAPPAYRHSFCGECGAPLPIVWNELPFVEIPLACLDDDVASIPVYQMFDSQKFEWLEALDRLPRYDRGAPFGDKVIQTLL